MSAEVNSGNFSIAIYPELFIKQQKKGAINTVNRYITGS